MLSVLHAVIPSHWLPILAIGRREKWTLPKVMKITFVSALAHVTSTLAIGGLLALLGATAIDISDYHVSLIGAAILVILGIVYIYRHHRHKHFHINEDVKRKRSDRAIIIACVGDVAVALHGNRSIFPPGRNKGLVACWCNRNNVCDYYYHRHVTTGGLCLSTSCKVELARP